MGLKDMTGAMSECNQEETIRLVHSCAQKGAALKDILDALTDGLNELGEKFSRGEAYIPELVYGAEIFQEAMKILQPMMASGDGGRKVSKGKVVMATVKGDLHDIGKNLVVTFLNVGGYQVIDLGSDVPNERLMEVVKAEKPDVVGLSSLLTTTMLSQRQFMRDQVKVIVGGAPVSQAWADEIGADAFGADAVDGKNKIDALLGVR
jgi:5-methyltetrahydrofolate--homocysteine methyltransferase